MGFQNFFKNRYNVLYAVIVLLLCVLGFRMAVLTIVHGTEYRETADVKKIKDIPVKAPRGKIYDRNGAVLADNVTSFTVQMYIDQIEADKFNEESFALSKILDENGERPIDEFPIKIDTFEYINEQSEKAVNINNANVNTGGVAVNSYKSAEEKVIELVKGNLYGWLNYQSMVYNENFNPKLRVLNAIKKDLNDIPVDLVNGQYVFIKKEEKAADTNNTNTSNTTETNKTENTQDTALNKTTEKTETDPVKKWLEENELNRNDSAEGTILELLLKENKYITNLFSNSKIRHFSYDYLSSKNLISNIKLVDYSFVQDDEYKNIKNDLNMRYPEINDTTNAKDDFVFLTMKFSIDNLLKTIYKSNNGNIMPGKILVDRIKEMYSDLPVEFKENGESGTFEYTNDDVKNKYLNQLHLDSSTNAYDFIKELAVKNYDILCNVITDDSVKYFSQLELLKYENPNISISEWEYTPIRNKRNWIINNLKLKENDKAENYNAKEVFAMLRDTLKIDKEISDYDLRNMLVIKERYNKTSYLSYHPVDICYGISEKSVAMISERSHELNGINVEIEPLRYYPNYDSAAHVLGYLGKISQDYEVNSYVNEQGYSPDDIIGKTGVEEKFESYLRGTKGKKTVEVNNVGKTIQSISNEAPVPGDNLYLTLDSKLQKTAEAALKKGLEQIQVGGVFDSEWGDFHFRDKYKNAKSGALVAIDVKTGEVLALANYPSYDLNLFSTGISSEDWNSLMNVSKDPIAPRPLYNIALLSAIQPGSTFKMVTGLTYLEEGADPNVPIYDAGTEKVGDRNFSCWIYNMFGGAHGYQTMYQALQNSCNYYFYTTVLGENLATGQKYPVKITPEQIIDTAKKLGLNDKTGIEIDLPRENSGSVPSIESKKLNIRVYLRLFLESNIEKYLEDGYKIDESMKNEIVEEIVSWIDREQPMTRGEVYEGLKSLKVNPDKTNESGVPIVDIIKYTYVNDAVWNVGDSLNMSIGQGDNAYSTIQMANYVATIANGGYKHNVSVVKEIKTYDGKSTDYVPVRNSERIELKDYSHLDVLKKGMLLVSENDSAKPYSKFPVQVGSKTGTAQNQGINPETKEPYNDFAWYVAFAPYDDPQIAVACVLFQGGSGRYPTPIVREVIGEYLKLNNITGAAKIVEVPKTTINNESGH